MSFKPTSFKLLEKNNIQYEDFEDSKNPAEIQAANIQGYPTIMITNDNNQTYPYMGQRNLDSLIREIVPELQIGGNFMVQPKKIVQYPFLCEL